MSVVDIAFLLSIGVLLFCALSRTKKKRSHCDGDCTHCSGSCKR